MHRARDLGARVDGEMLFIYFFSEVKPQSDFLRAPLSLGGGGGSRGRLT